MFNPLNSVERQALWVAESPGASWRLWASSDMYGAAAAPFGSLGEAHDKF